LLSPGDPGGCEDCIPRLFTLGSTYKSNIDRIQLKTPDTGAVLGVFDRGVEFPPGGKWRILYVVQTTYTSQRKRVCQS